MTTLSTGQRFADRYEVRRLLGQGGFGEVYVVRDLRAQPPRELALKVLTETEGLRNVDLVRFRDEIVAINTVAKHSQHVPRVHDTGMDRGRPWFVMDLVQGVTLTEHWQHQHTLGLRPTPAETLTILHDVCDALAAAHAVGLVHCDLKPENIMIKRAPSDPSRWFAYVLDFGIARTAYKHTQRTLAGTPLWMAPEQLTDPDAPSTPAIDQFSFAHVAFWMLVGQKFPLTERQRMRPSQVAAARNVTLPRAFDAWFDRATRDAPTERFPDIALAFNALHAVFAQPPVADPAFAPTLQAPAHIALAPTLAATPPKPPPYAPAKAPQSLPTPRPAATRPVALVVVLVASLASLAVGLTWRSHNATRSHQTLSPTQTPPPAPPPAPPPLPVPTELTPITEP
ncbi:MAG: serine/threonine-protein kinase, partial [Deltaproteobacteria bacterium]|nr:serine/threonine-protein kinase [Deltaproteobacteria bacterium]